MDTYRVTVVVPTIGRPAQLRETLASLARCEPLAAEVLVIDQSPELVSRAPIDEVGLAGVRLVPCAGLGRGLGVNRGLEEASHEIVLVVDDDCTVRPDWVAVAWDAMAQNPEGIITGQVLPPISTTAVPSIYINSVPHDYTGELGCGALYAGNMACSRDAVLELGGFDPRIVPAAEDCDLCYRWLRAGRTLRFVPELVVWHRDWRTPDELVRHYRGYWLGQGRFYAKHLRTGDFRVVRFIATDCSKEVRAIARRFVRGTPRWADDRRGALRGLAGGLWRGWREFSESPSPP